MKELIKKQLRQRGLEIKPILDPGREGHAFFHVFERLAFFHSLGFQPKHIWDVGASNGQWTEACMNVFPEATYFCVEPRDAHQKALVVRKADWAGRMDFIQACLGPERGTATMHQDGDGSSLLPGHSGKPYGEPVTVALETMDHLVDSGVTTVPELLKMDVQGFELEVVRGGKKAIQHTQAILLEAAYRPFQKGMPIMHEILKEMHDLGFVLADIFSLSLRPLDQMTAQSDLFFLKEGHALFTDHRWDEHSEY